MTRSQRGAVVGLTVASTSAAAGIGLGLYAALDENIGAGAASGYLCLFSVIVFITSVVTLAVAGRSARNSSGFEVQPKGERP